MKRSALLLLCCSCISSRQWEAFEAHAAETGIAAAGGALAVATGGTAGLAIAGVGMATGALVGEMQKPPAEVLEARTDKTGKTTYRYVEPKQARGESVMPEFSLNTVKWVLALALAWALLKALLGPRYRELMLGFLADAVRALGSLLRLAPSQAVTSAKSAISKVVQASGMRHSR